MKSCEPLLNGKLDIESYRRGEPGPDKTLGLSQSGH